MVFEEGPVQHGEVGGHPIQHHRGQGHQLLKGSQGGRLEVHDRELKDLGAKEARIKKMVGELLRAREVKEMTGSTPGFGWLGARAWWMSLSREPRVS